jgi:hypothetical protein
MNIYCRINVYYLYKIHKQVNDKFSVTVFNRYIAILAEH